MKFNGGNTKRLYARIIEILDYRNHSRLALQKKVLYSDRVVRFADNKDNLAEEDPITDEFSPTEDDAGILKNSKIEKINKIKKEMFTKYFAKDDYINSVEEQIYTERYDSTGTPLMHKPELEYKGPDAKELQKEMKDIVKKQSGFMNCLKRMCCRKKKSKFVSLEEINTERMLGNVAVGYGIQDLVDKQERIQEKTMNELETHILDIAMVPPSQKLANRFVRKEVNWFINSMEETREMNNKEDLGFSPARDAFLFQSDFDFVLDMKVQWHGESIIKVYFINQKLLVVPDFLWKFLDFFKTPFSTAPYYSSMRPHERFNNYPPMIAHIYFNKMTLIIPTTFTENDKSSIHCENNIYLRFEYRGDAYEGPGYYDMYLDMQLIKCYEAKLNYVNNMESAQSPIRPNHGGHKHFNTTVREFTHVADRAISNMANNRNMNNGSSYNDRKEKRQNTTKASKPKKLGKKGAAAINSGVLPIIMENISIVLQQRFETKFSKHTHQDVKADYISKFTIRPRFVQDDLDFCPIYLPVTLLTGLQLMMDLFNKTSADSDIENQRYQKNISQKIDKIEHEDRYNQIYEVLIPKIVLVIVREYKGEELIRLQLVDYEVHFRKERKDGFDFDSRVKKDSQISPKAIAETRLIPKKHNTGFMVTAGYVLGSFGVNYNNIRHMKFEPFIDPWSFEMNYMKIMK